MAEPRLLRLTCPSCRTTEEKLVECGRDRTCAKCGSRMFTKDGRLPADRPDIRGQV